jgi:putative ATP-dependent endonuclease of OLD family
VTSQSSLQTHSSFSVCSQEKRPDGESKFKLEFELSPAEVDDFRREVKSNLNGELPIEITLGKRAPGFKVPKKGPGGKALSGKAEEIGRFVAQRLSVEHIPAVRTAEGAFRVVREIAERELLTVDVRDRLNQAVQDVEQMQAPVLEALSADLQSTLSEFLEDVTSVRVSFSHARLNESVRRSIEVVVDDGTPTSLARKGDGVQSLAALSLMRHAWERSSEGRHLVLAIEEPESHLHPSAIQRLRVVLDELSTKHQVIMTTHCPLFVDRHTVGNNVLVVDNTAKPATDVAQIREILGVRASDNLTHAELVLLVEGEADRRSVSAILGHLSPTIRSALEQGVLAIQPLFGASNLSYELDRMRNAICDVHVLVDDDDAGRVAADQALKARDITDADLHLTTCKGKANAEFEDLIDPSCYEHALHGEFGPGLSTRASTFRSNRRWAERMESLFRGAGKRWDDRTKVKVKELVADSVTLSPGAAIGQHQRGVIDALAASLEAKLAALETG